MQLIKKYLKMTSVNNGNYKATFMLVYISSAGKKPATFVARTMVSLFCQVK